MKRVKRKDFLVYYFLPLILNETLDTTILDISPSSQPYIHLLVG